MANLTETATYDAGVYQIETSDPVLGGPSGTTNAPLKNLANRTAYLKQHVDALEAAIVSAISAAYVQAELDKLPWKKPVRVATTANISLSNTQTIDGVSVQVGDRVLVKDQTTASQNGIYVCSATAWTRATDADENAELVPNIVIEVSEGTANKDTQWRLSTDAPITVGTTALAFARVSTDLSGYAPLANPGFTGNPTAPTAAQFDNDTSLATTAFVQRALGNLAGQVNITTSATLSAGDVGKRININAASLTVTLPALSSVPAGSIYWVRCSVGPVTIAKQAGDSLQAGDTLPTTVTLQQSEFAIFVAGIASWNVEGGDMELAYSPRFNASLAANGYQKLPNGLIIQWGTRDIPNGTFSVTLPITFPTACQNVSATQADASNTGATGFYVRSFTTSTLNFFSNGAKTAVYWVAIGY